MHIDFDEIQKRIESNTYKRGDVLKPTRSTEGIVKWIVVKATDRVISCIGLDGEGVITNTRQTPISSYKGMRKIGTIELFDLKLG